MTTAQEIRPEIEAAIVHLQRNYKMSKKDAENTFLAGVARIAELAGEPIPPKELNLALVSELINSGRYAELEVKARQKADRILEGMGLKKPQVQFERARPKNKFI